MALRTYLEMVNDVLRALREPEVATWNESDYSTLIGGFVNLSKRAVESAWKWSALRQTITQAMTPGTSIYSLTGTDDRAEIEEVYNFTVGGPALAQRTQKSMNYLYLGTNVSGVQTGHPDSWAAYGVDSSGLTRLRVHPQPDSADSLRIVAWVPQADLSADSTGILVPHTPVVETAIALARGERGEDGGISTSEAGTFAAKLIADSVAMDAMKNADLVTWEPV